MPTMKRLAGVRVPDGQLDGARHVLVVGEFASSNPAVELIVCEREGHGFLLAKKNGSNTRRPVGSTYFVYGLVMAELFVYMITRCICKIGTHASLHVNHVFKKKRFSQSVSAPAGNRMAWTSKRLVRAI